MNSVVGAHGLDTRSVGAWLVAAAGLWIASDNLGNTNTCCNKFGYAGICLLPY